MRVAAQIIQHLFRAAERRFTIDAPFRLAAGLQESIEISRIVELLERLVKLQFTRRVRFLKIVEETAAEKTREHANGQKEAFAGRDPLLSIAG